MTNVVCGDAYILEGQSNAVATDSLPADSTNSTWIRTYGQTTATWGNAVRNGSDFWIGYWGYQQYFVDMSAAWKQDYPNLQRYIIYQVMPPPCSMGPKGDQLRDVQRTLPAMFSKMHILNTLGISGYLGCHFSAAGYQGIADRTAPLVNQDFYGIVPGMSVTAPILQRAYYTTAARTEIALEFDQNMSWNNFSTANYWLDKAGSKVSSGSVSGNVVKLQLSSAGTTTSTLDYLEDTHWSSGESTSSLLYGANGIPALTFADVPLSPVPLAQSVNTPEDTPVAITLTATNPNGDTLAYSVVSGPAHGTLTGTAPNVTYNPATNYNGPDGFTFKVNDGTIDSAAATVTITVNPSSFTAWAADSAQGLTAGVNDGPLQDPDHDGISNLLEFVLGGRHPRHDE